MHSQPGSCVSGVGRKVALVLESFPGRSENFIYREILELHCRLQDFAVISVRCGDPQNWEVMVEGQSLTRVTHHVLESGLLQALLVHARWLLRSPVDYGRTVLHALSLHHGRWLRAARQFHLSVMLADLAQQSAIEHLHAAFANHIANIVHLAACLIRIPYSLSAHAHDLWVERPLAVVMNKATCCLACTRTGREFLAEAFPGARTALVRHGIRLPTWWAAGSGATSPLSSGSVLRIVSAGRFVPKKGFDTIIEACRLLDKQGILFECDIFGDGLLCESLARQIRRAGLQEKVRLPGFISHWNLMLRLREAQLFVLPCRIDPALGDRDGVPNVLLEAMACGTIVIAGDIPTVREIIEDQETGYLACSNQPLDLVRVILLALEHRGDWDKIRARAVERLSQEHDTHRNIMTFMSNIGV